MHKRLALFASVVALSFFAFFSTASAHGHNDGWKTKCCKKSGKCWKVKTKCCKKSGKCWTVKKRCCKKSGKCWKIKKRCCKKSGKCWKVVKIWHKNNWRGGCKGKKRRNCKGGDCDAKRARRGCKGKRRGCKGKRRGCKGKWGRRYGKKYRWARFLRHFAPENRAKLKQLRIQYMQTKMVAKLRYKLAKAQLLVLTTGDNKVDMARLNELVAAAAAAKAEIIRAKFTHQIQVRALLKPKHRAKYDLMRLYKAKRGKKRARRWKRFRRMKRFHRMMRRHHRAHRRHHWAHRRHHRAHRKAHWGHRRHHWGRRGHRWGGYKGHWGRGYWGKKSKCHGKRRHGVVIKKYVWTQGKSKCGSKKAGCKSKCGSKKAGCKGKCGSKKAGCKGKKAAAKKAGCKGGCKDKKGGCKGKKGDCKGPDCDAKKKAAVKKVAKKKCVCPKGCKCGDDCKCPPVKAAPAKVAPAKAAPAPAKTK